MTAGIPNDYIAAAVIALACLVMWLWARWMDRRAQKAADAIWAPIADILSTSDAELLDEGMALVRNSETPIFEAVRYEHDLRNLREDMAAFGGESA